MLYTLYLNFRNKIIEYTLPSCNNRKLSVDISSKLGINECCLSLEIMDKIWRMRSDQRLMISDAETGNAENEIVLEDGKTINVNIRKTAVSFAVLVVAVTENIHCFRKYSIIDTVKIGNDDNAEINICDGFVSKKHAVISHTDKQTVITDFSKNGIYINNTRADAETVLGIFDIIYIFGTKIIYLGNVLAVNNQEKTKVTLAQADIDDNCVPSMSETDELSVGSPRLRTNSDKTKSVIESPELKSTDNNKKYDIYGFIKLMMPSAAILSSAANFRGDSVNIAGMIGGFAVISIAGGAAFNFLYDMSARYLYKKNQIYNKNISDTYFAQKEKEFKEKQQKYRDMVNSQFRSTDELTDILETESSYLWNRSRNDDDFLKIRLGTGQSDFSRYIDVSQNVLKNDNYFKTHACDLMKKYKKIKDIVICVDLCSQKIFGLIGENDRIYETAGCIAVETAAIHKCSDVRIMIFYDKSESEYFSWMRWLPHTFSSGKKQRYAADSFNSYKNILFILTDELSRRTESRNEGYTGRFFPHYVVFCSSEKIFRNETILKYIVSSEELGVTFILMYNNSQKLPNQCRTVISRIKGEEGIYRLDEISDKTVDMNFDDISYKKADHFARGLIGLYEEENNSTIMPDSINYFDMISVRHPEEIDILKRYKMNRAYESICACIGVSDNNKLFCLDIHEKKHGPHGLVAGTTGSGKSEALQTMIISIAMNYHPDEISFVLIDYKGGGMSDIFEHLPHTAGIVTNITDISENGCSQARRALISIKSEIKRRQKIFKSYNLNHIDAYMQLFRAGKTDEPLPHIIIVVDEFAELKKEQPDFISQLVSTARVGRSLGLHLILATQKPTGVVDEQIWSNSRFRLCLKVQDKTDSIGMLKRPEAASLTVTGRAYIQIGNNEIFDMVQTAYSGAVYNSDDSFADRDSSAYMIDIDGNDSVIRALQSRGEQKITQLDAMVHNIIKTCSENNIICARKLWLDPLPSVLSCEDTAKFGYTDFSSGLVCVIGAVDDPENQDIRPAVLDMYENENIIIAGNTGSGKTTLINTMLCSLLENYSPDKVNLYIFDFAGGLFDVYRKVPHCIDVFSSVTDSTMKSFFNNIFNEIHERKLLFIKAGVSNYRDYSALKSNMPSLVICFDGYYLFRELYPENDDDFMRVSRDCVKYGIYIIVSVKQIADMKFKTRQNFKTIIPLQLNDFTEYNDIFGLHINFDMPQCSGRGFIKYGKVMEFQTAVCFNPDSASDRTMQMSEKFELISSKYSDSINKKHSAANKYNNDFYCLHLKNVSASEYSEFADSIINNCPDVYIWAYNKINLNYSEINNNVRNFIGTDGAYDMLVNLKNEFSARNQERKKYGRSTYKNLTVIICSMADFCKCIYDDEYEEDMSGITEIFFREGSGLGISFISDIDTKSRYLDTDAARIFMSYNTGVDYA